jgi:hypothetical protein
MKKAFVFMAFIISLSCSAQTSSIARENDLFPTPFFGQNYILSPKTKVFLNDSIYRRTPVPLTFDFYGIENDKIYIKFTQKTAWQREFIVNGSLSRAVVISPNNQKDADEDQLYYVRLGSIRERFEYIYKGVEFGYLGLPLKIRPTVDTFATSFATDVGVGTYLGYQIGKVTYSQKQFYRRSLTFAFFAAPSIISLNSTNMRRSTANGAFTVLGLSAGSGLIFSLNNYELGLVLGVDWVDGANAKSWVYNSQTWFGVSVGTMLRRAKPN